MSLIVVLRLGGDAWAMPELLLGALLGILIAWLRWRSPWVRS